MSKLINLIRHPIDLFKGVSGNPQDRSGPIYVVGFSTWKQYMRKYFSDRKLVFLPKDISEQQFDQEWKSKIARSRNCEIFVWGYKAPEYILQLSKEKNSPVRFVEDGFVRSIELGATKAPPMSLCIDSKTPYFDCRQSSDLEELIRSYDFSQSPALLERANALMDRFVKSGISKYNHILPVDIEEVYGPKTGKRVLVIGQVEDDASIVYGASRKLTNKDVIDLAVKENPDAQIIYKTHPDVVAGFRFGGGRRHIDGVQVITVDLPLYQAFHGVDSVYTISSLGGFEAALRGIKVVTLGAPFYSGWGFTDDRDPLDRRTTKRLPLEVFALAYLKYARYYDPLTGKRIELENVLDVIEAEMRLAGHSPEIVGNAKPKTQSKSPASTKVSTKTSTVARSKDKPAKTSVTVEPGKVSPKTSVVARTKDKPVKTSVTVEPEKVSPKTSAVTKPKDKPAKTLAVVQPEKISPKAPVVEQPKRTATKPSGAAASSKETKSKPAVESKKMPTQTLATATSNKEVKSKPAAPKPAAIVEKPAVSDEPVTVPAWYVGENHQVDFTEGRPTFVYLSWIAEHGDALVAKLRQKKSEVDFRPLEIVEGVNDLMRRRDVIRFAREHPELFRKMVIRRLVPIREKITGFIFTLDWLSVMRIIADVCAELDIPRILIPHESVFLAREKYYWDRITNASAPVCDLVLGWGDLQRDIFVERGYPAERFIAVGAPKFDTYYDYKPRLTRAQYYRLFGLDPSKKTIIFASQPLDSQLNTKTARESQRQAIRDILAYCVAHDCQLIVRLPPSKDDILGTALFRQVVASGLGAVDDAVCYLVPPDEAIYHSDVVTSVNSTMLFEGILAGRPALSLKYVEFDQIWEKAGIPAVTSGTDLPEILDQMLAGRWQISQEAFNWAAKQFGVGQFDGQAVSRITGYLHRIAQEGIDSLGGFYRSGFEKIKRGERVDVAAISSPPRELDGVQKYLAAMLGCNKLLSTIGENVGVKELGAVELFLQWGMTLTAKKKQAADLARGMSRDILYVEPGFLQPVNKGEENEPVLSVVLDTRTSYCNASKPSLMEEILNSGWELGSNEHARTMAVLQSIREGRISKSNSAPEIRLDIADNGRPKVLVIDQRTDDKGLASGGASGGTFQRMLLDAVNDNPQADILVKLHPDAVKGGANTFFASRPEYADFMSRLHYLSFDINPHSLFDIVQKVYTVTSDMGFEALLVGKEVHVYGGAYYAGWGVTIDHFPKIERRQRHRSVEEIFFVAYIMLSRYYDLTTEKRGEIESIIKYILEEKRRLKQPNFIA